MFKDNSPVALNSKTLDLLLVLITHRGELLSKDELKIKLSHNFTASDFTARHRTAEMTWAKTGYAQAKGSEEPR